MSAIKNTLHSVLHKFKLDVHRYPGTVVQNSEAEESLFHAKRMKIIEAYGVNVLLDIGANVGQYATDVRRSGYADRIISFEPIQKTYQMLCENFASDPSWEAHNTALGEADTSQTIHVSNNLFSSSFMPMAKTHLANYPESNYTNDESVSIARLDTIAPRLVKPGDRLFMKMDVQGYELNVLKGAVATLSQVQVVESEMCLTPLYMGQPLLGDIVSFLYEAGFTLVSLINGGTEQKTGYTLWIDGIFVRHV